MSKEKLEARIAALAEPFIAAQELSLWGIELAMANKPMVRIFVDNEEGASIDQCARISRHLGMALEVEDVMQSAYILEVSSPGLERPFFSAGQMAAYIGRYVELSLFDANPEWPNRRKFRGELMSVDGDEFVLRPCEPTPIEPVKAAKPAKGKKKAAEAVDASAEAPVEAVETSVDVAKAAEPMLHAHWDDVKKAHLIHIFPEPGHNKPK